MSSLWLLRGSKSFRHGGGGGAMKVKYDPEADAVFLRLAEGDIVDSEEMQPGMIVDFDADGKIVAIEFLNAKERFSSDTIEQFSAAA